MYLIYQLIIVLVLIIASPYFLFMIIVEKHGIRERLGLWKFKKDDRKVVWFHAASMGELKVINNVLPELLKNKPDIRVVISTMTKTGKTRAQKLFEPIEVFYVPIDFPLFIKQALKRVEPSLLVLVETEIWPVLISESSKANTMLAIVNGRLSSKSMRLYELFGSLFGPVVKELDIVMAQTRQYSERFIELGVKPENVSVMGNIKFDQVLDLNVKPLDGVLDKYINRHDRFVFIAGSIWPNEFDKVIKPLKKLQRSLPQLSVILAPRHMKNLPRLEESLSAIGLSYFKRSAMVDGDKYGNVMVLDTMGELSSLYRYADFAFVGGSFVNVGGHDPLEPASSGCPVCFGPNMGNSRMFVDILLDSGGAFYVSDEHELEALLAKMLNDKSMAKELGRKARQVVLDNSGVSKGIATKLAEFI